MADDNVETVPLAVRTSDLPVRVASAAVMLAVAGAALWLGGMWLDGFIAVVALACFYEFVRLVLRIEGGAGRFLAIAAGALYIGLAAAALIQLSVAVLIGVIAVVIATDTGAYFSGRTIGGPKIAPSISPSKTWAGLGGGVVGAAVALVLFIFVSHAWTLGLLDGETSAADTYFFVMGGPTLIISAIAAGAILAVLAQAGDFFESWMKRRAKVKDSSQLIPGHGGVFDRIDGLLPVSILIGLLSLLAQ